MFYELFLIGYFWERLGNAWLILMVGRDDGGELFRVLRLRVETAKLNVVNDELDSEFDQHHLRAGASFSVKSQNAIETPRKILMLIVQD